MSRLIFACRLVDYKSRAQLYDRDTRCIDCDDILVRQSGTYVRHFTDFDLDQCCGEFTAREICKL